ncbi:MAG: hypothetical protein ACHQD8_03165, partial [Chitinophagales bacterium]
IMRKSGLLTFAVSALITMSVFIFTAACHKSLATADNGYAAEQATTEKTFSDIQGIADQAATLSSGSHITYRTTGTTSSGCATIYKSGDSAIIDFGPTDCTCLDGRKRRGKIIVTYTGNYMDSGSVHTITFDNFYQNDNKVTGIKTVTYIGHNASGQPTFNVTINGSVTLNGGGTISANWSRVRTWTAGYDTPLDFTDDVYTVSGSGTLVRANGAHVAANIPAATPLVFAFGCRWIEAGTINFTLPGGATRSLNYGNTPACDDQAQLTLPNGAIYNITMP